ncbi:MAG: hypothetical protein NTX13_03595 [Acidobacteria bacterium]|nr:hypothetical protein [Acidobacteriota bacterium]
MSLSRRQSLAALLGAATLSAQQTANLPNVGLKSDAIPSRSECGVGALMPWADALWAVTYNSHKAATGTGLALYRIDSNLKTEQVHTHNGTHANRYLHKESSQAFIGPYAIDAKGNWRFLEALKDVRLTGTMTHLKDPANLVYMLGMEGELYEVDVSTLKVRLLDDLTARLGRKRRAHFKGAFTGQGRLVVANNGFYEFGEEDPGLAEFDGAKWNILSRKPHMECMGRENMGNVIFCTGWDECSVLLWALVKGKWQRYRLPKGGHVHNHAWQTEWMRIREVETEHYLMDIHGLFYELQPIAWENAIWGVKPICNHLRIIPDFTAFRGLLALAGNQTSPNNDNNRYVGQPQSGIWFGKSDDLWQWGKPSGWGGPWRNTPIAANTPSDPFLMTGFGQKVLHLSTNKTTTIAIEIDFLGNGSWVPYEKITLSRYAHHVFPAGFSAHWVRLTANTSATLSAEFIYS